MIKKSFTYFILSLMLIVAIDMSAQKVDTLIHINGNVMTGEIKKLVDGIVFFKMDGMGTIHVELEKINTFKTKKLLQIRTKQGTIIFGQIDTSNSRGYVRIGYGVNKTNIRVLDIVEIYPIKSTFWLRTSGDIDFGIDYAKSTKMFRANTSGLLSYRRKKTNFEFEWNTYASSQALDTVDLLTQKADAMITYKQLIKGSWLWTGNIGENSNSELGLDLRLYIGATIQNDLIYTNRQHLYAQMGFAFNREFPTEGEILDNPEAVFSISYNIYKHSSPEISLTSKVEAHPNLKFNGRWRLDSQLDLNVEIFYNFYVGFKVYSNFDSMPASENAENTDWGSTFTLGYSFN